jgi:hypothetical protein
MTLNVNLEDVPWAILEAVRGRIMSNRRRLEESQQEQQRPALQPKPQFRKFGADGRTWKRPEPAAVISDQRKQLPYFYQSIFDPGFIDPGNRTITMWSGNGQQSVTVTLPDPFPTFPDLELPAGVAAWANRDFLGPAQINDQTLGPIARAPDTAFPPYTGTGKAFNVARTYGLRRRIPGSGDLNPYFEVGQYSAVRVTSTSISSYREHFPLGNGKCLVVLVFRDALISEIVEQGYSTIFNLPGVTPWFPSPSSDITEFIDYNNRAVERDIDVTRVAAFVCSTTEARQVSISSTLENEIKSRAPIAIKTTLQTHVNTILNTWWWANQLDEYKLVPVTGYWRNFGGDQNFPPAQSNRFPAYGWNNPGFENATPSSWVTIGSTPAADYDTHEEIQAHEIDGKNVGSILRRGYYYGILDSSNPSDPPSKRLLFWQQGLPTGDLITADRSTFLPALPVPGEPLGGWRATVNQVPSFGTPDASPLPDRIYIHDWGNPAFCRQQAQRWGVADL